MVGKVVMFGTSAITKRAFIQFNVTGEGEGAFYLEAKDGKVDVEPYDYNDRDIMVTACAKSLGCKRSIEK